MKKNVKINVMKAPYKSNIKEIYALFQALEGALQCTPFYEAYDFLMIGKMSFEQNITPDMCEYVARGRKKRVA